MEDRYKKYQEFDWAKSDEWQSWLRNVYPVPPAAKLQQMRKKWYKRNIDKDFDVDYTPASQDSQYTPAEQERRRA